jgi:proteasome accessory factor B
MAKEEAWKPARTDKSERLFQLTCVLLYSERGLTKRELFHAVDAYRSDLAASNEDDFALNKKFERDKAELRDMGIQVTNPDPRSDPDEMRYTIASETFTWPEEIKFDSKQLQLLNLAAQVWAQASLSSDANRGLVRLRGLGIEPAASDLFGFAPRLRTHEPSFLPLSQAIEEHIEVSFDYRKADGELSKRLVQPWLLRSIDGQWLLVCWDKQQKAVRNFLLKRIVSKVIFRTEQVNEKETTAERSRDSSCDRRLGAPHLEPVGHNQGQAR